MKNQIAKGTTGTKNHLWNGPRAMCKANSQQKEYEVHFIETFRTHPDYCCVKCVAYLKRIGKI
jgi:hypothetical protein